MQNGNNFGMKSDGFVVESLRQCVSLCKACRIPGQKGECRKTMGE